MANAKEIVDSYTGGPVGRDQIHLVKAALDFLISIQPADDDPDGGEKFEQAMEEHADTVQRARSILRALGQGIEPKTLEAMQYVFYGLVNSRRYKGNQAAISCVSASLSRAWNGIGPWLN